ncbi:MAG: acyl-CoA thioesterase [Propionibacteriaceae bacterium]|jgi:acyl-CoA thioester hydrolase|nr:acyl-CoA thioesterase [Propionibacteriaceae bacterium]
MSTRLTVPLRWGDLDAQGHVNNARFIDYLQEARVDFLLAGPVGDLIEDGLVVVGHQIEYRAPVVYSETALAVDLQVSRVDQAGFGLAYQLWQRDRLVAVARTELRPYDLDRQISTPLGPTELAWLEQRLEPAEDLRPLSFKPMTDQARSAPMRVRWSDLDAYGHVNNTVFFDYIQEGRIAFTAAAVRSMNDSVDQGHLWFVARQDLDYLAPVLFRRLPYVVRTGVAHLGRTSLTFCSEVADPDNGRRFAQATTVAVFADQRGRPTPVLPEWKQALERYRLD